MQSLIFENADDAIQPMIEVFNIKNPALNEAILVVIGRESLLFAQGVAKSLKIPLEFLFTEIITSPVNPECSVAAVSEDMEILINEELINAFGISLDYVYGEAQRKYEDVIIPSRYRLRKGEGLTNLKDKDVIVLDLGIETGLRVGVAIKTCMNLKAKSVSVASPIMPKVIFDSLSVICDDVYCAYPIDDYVSCAHYFPHLQSMDDELFEAIFTKSSLEKKANQ